MPAIASHHDEDTRSAQVPPNAFRVLVTGFGPFTHYGVNPSWLAVEPLQNIILHTDPHSKSPAFPLPHAGSHTIPTVNLNGTPHDAPRSIHITTLQVPVVYDDVLSIVPGLHARPPRLPPHAPETCAPPPEDNYDFIFHLGVAGRGPLRMERIGHKLGYHMKDANGKLAPVVRVSPKDFSRRTGGAGEGVPGSPGQDSRTLSLGSAGTGVGGGGTAGGMGLTMAETVERDRLGIDMVEADAIARPTRGFGVGYENFPDEITTNIDVTRLVHDLKKGGIEQIYTSMDAGHYLCDFVYYCSLAEVRRSAKPYEKRRHTQVLFLHCPPVDQPLSTAEVTEAIRRIVVWVCSEQQADDAKEVAGVAGVTA